MAKKSVIQQAVSEAAKRLLDTAKSLPRADQPRKK